MSLPFVFIGHTTLDVKENGTSDQEFSCGGGVFFGSQAAQTLGAVTSVLTKFNPSDRTIVDAFGNTQLLSIPSAHSTTMKNVYLEGKANKRVSLCLHQADPFTEQDISNPFLLEAVCVLSPLVNGEFPESLIPMVIKKFPIIGLDVQGYTRHLEGQKLVQKDWPLKTAYLKYISVLKIDEDEATALTGIENMDEAIQKIASMGNNLEIICTHVDGIKLYSNGKIFNSLFGNWDINARTGRGDTVLASFMVLRMKYSDPQILLDKVALIATHKMNIPGPLRCLPDNWDC
ncbi:hypothetical protein RCL1_003511 [Eukaryota sp. TZLM3-RCL]